MKGASGKWDNWSGYTPRQERFNDGERGEWAVTVNEHCEEEDLDNYLTDYVVHSQNPHVIFTDDTEGLSLLKLSEPELLKLISNIRKKLWNYY